MSVWMRFLDLPMNGSLSLLAGLLRTTYNVQPDTISADDFALRDIYAGIQGLGVNKPNGSDHNPKEFLAPGQKHTKNIRHHYHAATRARVYKKT
jgi:hypothetical protein